MGGANFSSTPAEGPTTINPRKKITKTAGPSPASCPDRSSPQTGQAGRTASNPAKNGPSPQRGQRQVRAARRTGTGANRSTSSFTRPPSKPETRSMLGRERGAHAPPVNADEQEQPDDIDEMPVPGGRLETEMMIRLEVAPGGGPQAHGEKNGPDDHMEAVKPGRHEESRGIDAAGARGAGI